MKKRVLIVGHANMGTTTLAKTLAEEGLKHEDAEIITLEEAKERGITITDVQEELELKLNLIEKRYRETFTPKKVHPKHQKNNKYNR